MSELKPPVCGMCKRTIPFSVFMCGCSLTPRQREVFLQGHTPHGCMTLFLPPIESAAEVIDPTWCGSPGCEGYPLCHHMRECQGDKAREPAKAAEGDAGEHEATLFASWAMTKRLFWTATVYDLVGRYIAMRTKEVALAAVKRALEGAADVVSKEPGLCETPVGALRRTIRALDPKEYIQ
ncbi:MAG: hypothetical protein E4H29_05680 [Deltaproteobacteria bacterium]|nr:MAG: hypothetical protein E4H29_05680 [Deltaproteobacteria bacterium]